MKETRVVSKATKALTVAQLHTRVREVSNELNTSRNKEHERARKQIQPLSTRARRVCTFLSLKDTATVGDLLLVADKRLQTKGIDERERNAVHTFRYVLRIFSTLNDTGKLDGTGKRLIKVRKQVKKAAAATPVRVGTKTVVTKAHVLDAEPTDGPLEVTTDNAEWEGLVAIAEEERDTALASAETAQERLVLLTDEYREYKLRTSNRASAHSEALIELRTQLAAKRADIKTLQELLEEANKKVAAKPLDPKLLAAGLQDAHNDITNLTHKNEQLLEANKVLNATVKKADALKEEAAKECREFEMRMKAAESKLGGVATPEPTSGTPLPADEFITDAQDFIDTARQLLNSGFSDARVLSFIRATIKELKL